MTIYAIIPAHNEADKIGATIRSVKRQEPAPDMVLVAADNCTDNTVKVCHQNGADVFQTVNNTARKAGALNQAIARLSPILDENDLLLIMDADTILADNWIKNALPELDNPRVGGVGAVFKTDRDNGWLAGCQAREYERYGLKVGYTGKTFVLSGTAALIRWAALRDVSNMYNGRGPYNPDAITEDFRLTADLLICGWALRSPLECETRTETMPTTGDLIRQRTRWSLGALQTVTQVKPQWKMCIYYWQQFMLALSILVGLSAYTLTAYGVIVDGLAYWWWSIAVLLTFWAERVITVWHMGWKHRLWALVLIPELVYAGIIQAAHAKAIGQLATGSRGTWSHIGGSKS